MKVWLLVIFLFSPVLLIAQKEIDFGSTSSTSLDPTHVSKNPVKKKRLLSWIKNSPDKTLMGNKCMDEFTQEMGFEYVLQPKGRQGNRSEFGRLLHNFGVKMGILFRNGPLWKAKLKKKRKECRTSTGDYVG